MVRARELRRRLAAGEEVRWGACRLRAAATVGDLVAGVVCACGAGARGAGPESEGWVSGSAAAGLVPCRRGSLARLLARDLLELLGREEDAGCRGRWLAGLAASPEPAVRTEAAGDPACPPGVQWRLARDDWWEVRAALAANPSCLAEVAIELAGDRNPWVRRAVAEAEGTPKEALRRLTGDPDLGVRDALAEHPRTPTDVLRTLVRDPAWEIRRSLAKRPDASADLLAELAGDPEPWVRFFVACHPTTPPEVRAALGADRHRGVRMVARPAGAPARPLALFLALDPRTRAMSRARAEATRIQSGDGPERPTSPAEPVRMEGEEGGSSDDCPGPRG
jgi:hypothetical protein